MTDLDGAVAGANKSDTWQWDGQDWTQLSDSGPSPRFSHAVAFDSSRNRTVLFAGIKDVSPEGVPDLLQGTWEFDGQDWTQQEDTGPAARGSHALTYDPSSSRVVLFGGSPALGDTWAWDGKTWAQIAEFGPPGPRKCRRDLDGRWHCVVWRIQLSEPVRRHLGI